MESFYRTTQKVSLDCALCSLWVGDCGDTTWAKGNSFKRERFRRTKREASEVPAMCGAHAQFPCLGVASPVDSVLTDKNTECKGLTLRPKPGYNGPTQPRLSTCCPAVCAAPTLHPAMQCPTSSTQGFVGHNASLAQYQCGTQF